MASSQKRYVKTASYLSGRSGFQGSNTRFPESSVEDLCRQIGLDVGSSFPKASEMNVKVPVQSQDLRNRNVDYGADEDTVIDSFKRLGISKSYQLSSCNPTYHSSTYEHTPSLLELWISIQNLQSQTTYYKKTTSLLLRVCQNYVYRGFTGSKNSHVIPNDEEHSAVDRWFEAIIDMFTVWLTRTPLESLLEWKGMRSHLERIINSQPSIILQSRMQTCDSIKEEDELHGRIKVFHEPHEIAGEDFYDLLGNDKNLREIFALQGESAKVLADLLYELMQLDPSKRRYERTLRRLCSRAGVLPSSFYILQEEIVKTSPQAVAGGGFSDVYEGEYKGQKVALKVLRMYDKENLKKTQKNFCKEAILWKGLNHPNIVPFLGIANIEIFPLCMVSAWMTHGNLLSYLRRYPRASRLDLASDIVNGLYYLHQLGLLHGDLKSANVLISDSCNACLADFGLASLNPVENSTVKLMTENTSVHGSIRWMAPELLLPSEGSSSQITPESDVYSLATTLFEVFTGNIPFSDQPRDALVVIQIIQGQCPPLSRPGPEVTLRGLDDEMWELMVVCWDKNPRKRPRLGFILEQIERIRLNYEPPVVSSPEECAEVEELVFPNLHVLDSDSESDESDGWHTRRDLTKEPTYENRTVRLSGLSNNRTSAS